MTNYVRVEDGAGGPVDPSSYTYSTGTQYESLASRCAAILSLADAAKALAEAAVELNGMWKFPNERLTNAVEAIANVARRLAEREVAE